MVRKTTMPTSVPSRSKISQASTDSAVSKPGGEIESSFFFPALSLIHILLALIPYEPMDQMLAAVCGGAMIGLAMGIIFAQGATTGGTDLIARLVKLDVYKRQPPDRPRPAGPGHPAPPRQTGWSRSPPCLLYTSSLIWEERRI